jgi:hypothetical protein
VLAPASRRELGEITAKRQDAHWLALSERGRRRPLAVMALVPRAADGVDRLAELCRRHGVALVLRGDEGDAERALARRAEVAEVLTGEPEQIIRERQRRGERVAFVSDSARAGAAFAACDLAVAVTSGRSGGFPARADLLAPDLTAVSAVIEAAARRDVAIRDATAMSLASNLLGVAWGLRGDPDVINAARITHITALAAVTDAWLRGQGGHRSASVLARLVDPRPERWGRQSRDAVLRAMDSRGDGLSREQAQARVPEEPVAVNDNHFANALAEQLRSPLAGLLAGGAAVSMTFGAMADVALIGAVILTNAAVGAWQERAAGEAAKVLERRGAAAAQVLRDGRSRTIAAREWPRTHACSKAKASKSTSRR